MKNSGLNSNKQRKEFWKKLIIEETPNELERALNAIDCTSAKVLRWHYIRGHSFQEIELLLNRSISIVRNHHNRGIFELQQYFLKRHSPANTGHL